MSLSDSERKAHIVRQSVDAPVPIMFWEPTEFTIAVSLMGFGILMNMWMFGLLGAVGVLTAASKLKRGAKRGAVQHWIWRMGLLLDAPLKKHFPPAWRSDFIE